MKIQKTVTGVFIILALSNLKAFSMQKATTTQPEIMTMQAQISPEQVPVSVSSQWNTQFMAPKGTAVPARQTSDIFSIQNVLNQAQSIAALIPASKDSNALAQNLEQGISNYLQNLPAILLHINPEQLAKGAIESSVLNDIKNNTPNLIAHLDRLISLFEFPTFTIAGLKLGSTSLASYINEKIPGGSTINALFANLFTITDKNSSEIATISEGVARILTSIKFVIANSRVISNEVLKNLHEAVVAEVQDVLPVITSLITQNKEVFKNMVDQLKTLASNGNLLNLLENSATPGIAPLAR